MTDLARNIYRSVASQLPPRISLSLQFLRHHGRIPNLARPQTFSELVQSRKLAPVTQDMVTLSNKLLAKDAVARMIGEEWIIPTIWSGDKLPDRRLRTWSAPFVIKASHGSGGNCFVLDENGADWDDIETRISQWDAPYAEHLKEDWYNAGPRQVLVEKYIGDGNGSPPDFKFFVFNGRVEFIQVDIDRARSHKRNFYDRTWRRQGFTLQYAAAIDDVAQPKNIERMIWAAETIGRGFEFVRVDFYDIEAGPKFGEVTFAPGSGFERFNPKRVDVEFGDLWLKGRQTK